MLNITNRNDKTLFFVVIGLNGSEQVSITNHSQLNLRYELSGSQNEYVTDHKYMLVWDRCAIGFTWNDTVKNCEGEVQYFNFAGSHDVANESDGRLPTLDELKSLFFCDYYFLYENDNAGYFEGDDFIKGKCSDVPKGLWIDTFFFPNVTGSKTFTTGQAQSTEYGMCVTSVSWGVGGITCAGPLDKVGHQVRLVRDFAP